MDTAGALSGATVHAEMADVKIFEYSLPETVAKYQEYYGSVVHKKLKVGALLGSCFINCRLRPPRVALLPQFGAQPGDDKHTAIEAGVSHIDIVHSPTSARSPDMCARG